MKAAMITSAALALLLAEQIPDQRVIVQADGHKCSMIGTATSAAGKTLNRRKNRFHPPADDDLDADVTLAALLAPGDDLDRFDEDSGAKIRGFVIDVKVGGNETCNCKANAAIDKDTHIELGLSLQAPGKQRVIVEVTPRLRVQMKAQDIDWTTEALRHPQKGIKGKFVEITGWLLFDTMHVNEAENTNPGHKGNWRATCWEIHPVTEIKVLPAPSPGADLNPQVLAEFHAAHAQQLRRDPAKQEALRKRNERLLAKFEKEELDTDGGQPKE